jgi:hypothetical protein
VIISGLRLDDAFAQQVLRVCLPGQNLRTHPDLLEIGVGGIMIRLMPNGINIRTGMDGRSQVAVELRTPTDDELKAYYKKHPDCDETGRRA